MNEPYDALLIVSFGGPEGMDDVMPFLENVLRGKNIPSERIRSVARHYELFGGISPINEQNRKLISLLSSLLKTNGPDLRIYFGNRNWRPMIGDTIRQMRNDGVRRALAFFTSAYSSYSGCRQYLENIEDARTCTGADAPIIEKLRAYYNHPGFIEPNIENLRLALDKLPEEKRSDAYVVFSAHSIPLTMAVNCEYESQLLETCSLVAAGAEHKKWKLVFQSRSARPNQEWLGPDISDYLTELKGSGTSDVIVSPVGFVSDHMEVIYDLDIAAKTQSDKIGLNMIRAASVGTHPQFVNMIRELIIERIDPTIPRRYVGARGPHHDVCPVGCCSYK